MSVAMHQSGPIGSVGYGYVGIIGCRHGGMEELRQQLHAKWEAEKKLQKRYVLGIMVHIIVRTLFN